MLGQRHLLQRISGQYVTKKRRALRDWKILQHSSTVDKKITLVLNFIVAVLDADSPLANITHPFGLHHFMSKFDKLLQVMPIS